MVTITAADPALYQQKSRGQRTKPLSPRAQEREQQKRQFRKLMGRLQGPEDVFQVKLGSGDKAVTVRQRLMKVAAEEGKEVAVRTHGKGFLVGIMTPERRSRPGRRPGSGRKPSQGSQS